MVVSLVTGRFVLTAPSQDRLQEDAAAGCSGNLADVDVSYISTGHLLVTVLTTATFYLMLRSYRLRRQRFQFFSRLGIPGPRPNLIKGNCDLMRNPSLLSIDVMEQWQRLYGNIYGYFIGQKPFVVCSHLDHVRQVLVKDFQNFINRPKLNIDIKPLNDTLVCLRGQRWKDVRRVLSPVFSRRHMRHVSAIVNCCVDILIDVVESQQHHDIEFHGLFQGLTCQVIGTAALNSNVECQRNADDKFLYALRQFFKNTTNPLIDLAIYFPIVHQLLAIVCRLMSPIGQFTQSIIDKVQLAIDQRRQERASSGAEEERHSDMLELLLDAAEDRFSDNKDLDQDRSEPRRRLNYLLSDDEIVANAWVFLLGGFETTANCLTYCCYLLAKHPHIQQRLYNEIVDHLQVDEDLSYEQVSQLNYLDQVISETLRLFPPVVLMVTREAANDTEIGGYKIPAGTNIQIPIWQIHHDPELWPNPHLFDPDRFMPELKKERDPMAWLPFGAGPRGCIGIRFGLLETKVALAKLLIKYQIVPCKRTEQNLTLRVPTVTLNPSEDGVWLAVEPR